MATTEPTFEELAARQDATERELVTARDELERAQERLNAAVVAGENEIAISRAQRAIDDAQAKIAPLEKRIEILDEAMEAAQERRAAETLQGRIRNADALLAERAAECQKIDKHLTAAAASIIKFQQLSLDTLAALPKRPEWTPPMFIPSSLTKLIGLRLMALTDGKLAPPHNSVTLHEAQQMPSLADRAAKERTEVLAQFGPQGTSPEGGAAARSNV